MKAEFIITSIIAIVIVLLGTYFYIFKNYKITNIKEYTSPDGSFSFQYPEFKGWTSSLGLKDGWRVSLHYDNSNGHANFKQLPSIDITLADTTKARPINDKNYNRETGEIFIGAPLGSLIVVQIPVFERYGFSGRKMAQMIMETFRFRQK